MRTVDVNHYLYLFSFFTYHSCRQTSSLSQSSTPGRGYRRGSHISLLSNGFPRGDSSLATRRRPAVTAVHQVPKDGGFVQNLSRV